MGASTLEQAEAARIQHADDLARLGAHAVGVERVGDGWAVVAHVEPGHRFDGPSTLKTYLAREAVEVPLEVFRSEIATPE